MVIVPSYFCTKGFNAWLLLLAIFSCAGLLGGSLDAGEELDEGGDLPGLDGEGGRLRLGAVLQDHVDLLPVSDGRLELLGGLDGQPADGDVASSGGDHDGRQGRDVDVEALSVLVQLIQGVEDESLVVIPSRRDDDQGGAAVNDHSAVLLHSDAGGRRHEAEALEIVDKVGVWAGEVGVVGLVAVPEEGVLDGELLEGLNAPEEKN